MKANQLEISTRRRKWPTHFGLPVSLCVCLFFFSGGNFERAVNCFLSHSPLSLLFSVQAPDTFWSIVCHT